MKFDLMWAVAAVALQAAAPSLPPPFPRDGISRVFESDRVVVWQGVLGVRGEPTSMHHHELDLIGVFLDDGQVRTKLPDGTIRDGSPFHRGSVAFQSKGVTHTEEVLIDGTRAIGIELKSNGGGPTESPNPSASVDSGSDGRVIVDNARVLIREFVWSNASAVKRDAQGRDVLIIPLESGQLRQSDPDRPSRTERLGFGQVLYRPRDGSHIETAASGTIRAIVVELK